MTSCYKTTNPTSANQYPHTEVDEYLEGSKREIRSGWERLAMKKELWKKCRSWFGQGKEQDIPGRCKAPTKHDKQDKTTIVIFPH